LLRPRAPAASSADHSGGFEAATAAGTGDRSRAALEVRARSDHCGVIGAQQPVLQN